MTASESDRRIDRQAALRLLAEEPLGALMHRAHRERMRRFPRGRVTFVLDTNPNYTNVCVTGCRFCAFHRPPGHREAYTLSAQQLADRAAAAAEHGATTVLLQGGHNPDVGLADWIGYIRAIRQRCPDIHIHPFSPPEIDFVARREGIGVAEVLGALHSEGITTLPGGGAEVLCARVRRELSPQKCSPETWLAIMEQAHRQGFRTTATLMYGHLERDVEILEHLFALRALQDRTGGFRAFIPWSYKPGRTELGQRIPTSAHPARYIRIVAVARLVLDNFDHIQSSWFSESQSAGQLSLLAGADDFGGLLVEENVLRQTGFAPRIGLDRLLALIRRAGFTPAQRDSDYRVLRTFPEVTEASSARASQVEARG